MTVASKVCVNFFVAFFLQNRIIYKLKSYWRKIEVEQNIFFSSESFFRKVKGEIIHAANLMMEHHVLYFLVHFLCLRFKNTKFIGFNSVLSDTSLLRSMTSHKCRMKYPLSFNYSCKYFVLMLNNCDNLYQGLKHLLNLSKQKFLKHES